MARLAVLVVAVVMAGCGTSLAGHSQQRPSSVGSAEPVPMASATPDLTYPPANGSPVAAQVLAPAGVMPAVALCTAPLQVFQNGNAGPDFCSDGALNVAAWRWYADLLQPPVMGAGPGLSPAAQKAVLCRPGPQKLTNVEAERAYWMAAAYYGWTPIDAATILMAGCN